MYKVNGEQCKKCGKLFHRDAKFLKTFDLDGNELYTDLCEDCNYELTVFEIMVGKHIGYKEAEKYLFDKMNEALDNIEPYHNIADLTSYDNWIKQLTNKNITASNPIKKQGFRYTDDVVPNAVVRMVKDNE